MRRHFIVHDSSDNVGVAMCDIGAGETVRGALLTGGRDFEVTTGEPISLGHKVALREIYEGEEVVRYGNPIGVATGPIKEGCHVHVHNVKSSRCGS